MAYTFTELKHMKLAQLKEIAEKMDNEEVQGYTRMHKEHLLEAICKALHIEMHVHHEIVGLDKTRIKSRIRLLKMDRDKALKAKDKKSFAKIRKEIKELKNSLRKATV